MTQREKEQEKGTKTGERTKGEGEGKQGRGRQVARERGRETREGERGQRRRETRERERGGRDICPEGTQDCLWIEKKQMWPIGKWQFIKKKGEPPC